MKIDFESEALALRLWRAAYQTFTVLKRCEDQVFEEHGLTTEQYAVLVSMTYLNEPVRVTDVARWLERSTNSISMIADRMVKAGLLRRVRNARDRRTVRLIATSKAEGLIKPANLSGSEFIQKIVSPLSRDDRQTLIRLLDTLRYRMLECLNHGVDVEQVRKRELKQVANLRKWLLQYGVSSTPKAKGESDRKRKTTRRR